MPSSLRAQLGPIPDGYTAQGGNRADDYQVMIHGPAGPAVIHVLDDDQGIEIETSFVGDHIRFDYGSNTPADALRQIVELNQRRMAERGHKGPPRPPKKPRNPAMVIALLLLAAGIALVIWSLTAVANNSDETPGPTPPSKSAPYLHVTLSSGGDCAAEQSPRCQPIAPLETR